MAVSEAVGSVDKGFDRADIQAAWFGELVTTDGFATGILADTCGLLDIPVSRLENACATGNDAVRHGAMAIASGMYGAVLVVGADKVRETSSRSTFWDWMGMTRDAAWDFPLGLVRQTIDEPLFIHALCFFAAQVLTLLEAINYYPYTANHYHCHR